MYTIDQFVYSDQERMRKVKEIYGWGAQQQGELNKLDRIKKKKQFRRWKLSFDIIYLSDDISSCKYCKAEV